MKRKTEARSYLTERQLQILSLRREGFRQAEVASRMGITRQDVAILEKRALRNIRSAAATLDVAKSHGIVLSFSIRKGTHILDAAKTVVARADKANIKLADSMVVVLSGISSACGSSLKKGRLGISLDVSILPDGRLYFQRI